MRWLVALSVLIPFPLLAGPAADLARAVRENTFDRDECYRVRDLTLFKDDIRIYLSEGHLIFSKPVAGRRIAAAFAADVENGDAEVIILPPNRAERRSLANYTGAPNLDEHFHSAVFLFTGDDYDTLKSQFPGNPANKKTPEVGALLDEQWTPVLRHLSESFQTRLTLDLLGGAIAGPHLFAAVIGGGKLGNFDVIFDPRNAEQISAVQTTSRDNRSYLDTWTAFPARSFRNAAAPPKADLLLSDFRIEATVNPDLSMNAVTRVKVKPLRDQAVAVFDISAEMSVPEASVDGQPAEVLERESLRTSLMRGGNNLFLVAPREPLRAGREYEFEIHHSGKVIQDAGDRVFYVSARGDWYPMHGVQFADYDLRFRYPRELDLVTPGDVVEDRTEGEWRITRRRTSAAIRLAGFNLGSYVHARLERASYTVDVCANRALERALQPPPVLPLPEMPRTPRQAPGFDVTALNQREPGPAERLQSMASEIGSALEFFSARFGPPTLPHVTVSPVPGTFGQGFPGLIYLSTLSYLKNLPRRTPATAMDELFFADILQAHELAHQWWGNRVTAASYRDNWLMEALANYSALLYLEKDKGQRATDLMLESYRTALLEKSASGDTVESTGPIVLGTRLENSQEPRAWRVITYDKGTWILHMLRRRMGDERFLAMLAEMLKRYDRQEISTDEFRLFAAKFLPAKSDDPVLESFFDQWVYGTGVPNLKLTYTVKGKAPTIKLVGTLTETDVDEDFSALAPVEIQVSRGQTVTQWVRSGGGPVTFTVALKQAPSKVTLDPHHAVLRR